MHTSPTAALGRSANGGMNVYVERVVAELGRAGVTADVFTLRRGDSPEKPESLGERGRVVYLDLPGVASLDKYLLAEHTDAFATAVDEFAARERVDYDLIFGHYWLSGLVGERLGRRWGAPWAQTAHTLALVKNRQLAPGARPEPAVRVAAERMIARTADLLIASTVAEADDLISDYGAPAEKVRVIPPGIELGVFSPRSRSRARTRLGLSNRPAILFVGRLERLKGVELVIRSLAEMAGSAEMAEFHVLGDDSQEGGDSERQRLAAVAADAGVAARVHFHGSVPQAALPDWYSAADVCVMPSYSESFGLVALEAQACGCPVVAANVAGLASVVRDGVTGYLVPAQDVRLYADRLGRLLGDLAVAQQMGRRAILLAQRFPWSRTAARVLDAFTDVSGVALAARPGAL